jgi:hypothetical protein
MTKFDFKSNKFSLIHHFYNRSQTYYLQNKTYIIKNHVVIEFIIIKSFF